MPPRRRIALIAAVAVLAVMVAVFTLAATAGRRRAPPAPQDRPGPVLLVPGYGGGTSAFSALATDLRSAGRDVAIVTLPGDGTGDLREQARTLNADARAALARTGAGSVDVVGYSAGGVVARLWVRSYGGAQIARRVVTLGSPHHGTDLAGIAVTLAPNSCPTACQQLAAQSPLLTQLNQGDETPDGPRWVSLWSTDDQVVTPPDSARLAGALDVVVQQVCPDVHVTHGELPADLLVRRIVLMELAATPVVTPTSEDCARLRASS
jgi:triacylglycerol esterase/lipase EstA (alpha/beta hydrolase family)